MTIGEKIQLCRKKKGMSQEDLANLLNVSRQSVQKWESGATVPEVNKLIAISDCFDISLDWLLKDANSPEENIQSEQEPIKEASSKEEPLEIQTVSYQPQRSGGPSYKAIKVWTILGIILTPLSIGGTILYATNYSRASLFALLIYLITIPVGIWVLHRVKYAPSKDETTRAGVVSLLFVSIIGGILILCTKESQFPFFEKPVEPSTKEIEVKPVEQPADEPVKVVDDENEEKKVEQENRDGKKPLLIAGLIVLAMVALVLLILL